MDEIVVFITAPSRDVARTIGQTLVEQKLAACANILAPLESIYTWRGQVHHEEEVLMILKTRAALFQQLSQAVKTSHPYEIPEIIAIPIQDGLPAYLNWITEVTQA